MGERSTREKLLDEETSVEQRPPSSAMSYPSFDSRDSSIKCSPSRLEMFDG
ncbi:hypothetical protein QCA50_012584 [Cerrena zonata]|uniref:Uncharacterized protein n=1 Tax=Cerrena zonata TaxID=2478898 RepID=A0AAW0FZH9_9APHY